MQTKTGYVSIAGRSNVGKSTLLNRLIGEKIAGVSSKPQTTRQTVRGIFSSARGQIVFLDTPGLHKPKDRLGERMVRAARKTCLEADLIYWMVFPALPHADDLKILEDLKQTSKPIFLLVNKVDQVSKPDLLPVLDAYQKLYFFRVLFPISAAKGDNVPELLNKTFELLPEGPMLFPADQISDQPERFIVSEMIREKIFRFTGEEIPYASAVEISEFKERSSSLTAIDATIYVEKTSQKKIMIGESGRMIKKIGMEARKGIEAFLQKKVFLQLWVKERAEWREDNQFLSRLESEGSNG